MVAVDAIVAPTKEKELAEKEELERQRARPFLVFLLHAVSKRLR